MFICEQRESLHKRVIVYAANIITEVEKWCIFSLAHGSVDLRGKL